MANFSWLILCVPLLAGCASHEGGFSDRPSQPAPQVVSAEKPVPVKPIKFHYAPDKSEYQYAVLTTETPDGGSTTNTELDFTVKVGHKGNNFTNDSTIQAVLNDGVQVPDMADKIKGFRVETTLDPMGKVLTSRATAAGQLLPQGAADLGSTFTLPAKAMVPGEKWTEKIRLPNGFYEATYTFMEIETVGKQRLATFEKEAADAAGTKSLRPAVIKIDVDTGVLVNKMAEVVFQDPNNPNNSTTAHFETKLK